MTIGRPADVGQPSVPVSVITGDLTSDQVEAFSAVASIAWDVETTGLDYREAKLGTCQLFADGVGCVIVKLEDKERPWGLARLLEDPEVEKVFHHAPFDLRFMLSAWNIEPVNIRCTKVASKLLRPQAENNEHSLKNLVDHYLGLSLAKGSVRTSDWASPSLSAAQIEYAVADVVHLHKLLARLTDELRNQRLLGLYDSCCAFLPARVKLEVDDYPDVFAY